MLFNCFGFVWSNTQAIPSSGVILCQNQTMYKHALQPFELALCSPFLFDFSSPKHFLCEVYTLINPHPTLISLFLFSPSSFLFFKISEAAVMRVADLLLCDAPTLFSLTVTSSNVVLAHLARVPTELKAFS